MSQADKIQDDHAWARQAFFIPHGIGIHNEGERQTVLDSLKGREQRGKRYSSAELKFTDTTPGGNYAMNARPQFTRFADPRMPGLTQASKGMGEYYSEAIDDNAQRIHLQFGVPSYNSLTSFFSRFYDRQMGHLANTGDASELIFAAGQAVGYILTAPLIPIIGLFNALHKAVKFIQGNPYSRFYYMKPTMPLYWDAVTTLVNRIGVNMGLVVGPGVENLEKADPATKNLEKDRGVIYSDGMSPDEFATMRRMLPDVFNSNGGIDVYAISTRAQRIANHHHRRLAEIAKQNEHRSFEDYRRDLIRYMDNGIDTPPKVFYKGKEFGGDLPKYLTNFYKEGDIGKGVGAKDIVASVEQEAGAVADKAAAGAYTQQTFQTVKEWEGDDFNDYFKAELADGSAFVSFNVDHTGSVSESFSNSTKTSEVAESMNSTSSAGRSAFFNMAGGNVGDNPLLQGIEAVVGGIKTFVAGGLDVVGLSGLSALGGAAYVDIPDFWDSASAELPKSSYTIKLASPYGNKLSIMTNIYIPLCMLLAGALPRTTGKNSYTSPFLCRLFDKGRNNIKLGIIDSIQITRGTGGIGWTADGLPTAVDVTFSVLNLSNIMHVPIDELTGPGDLLSFSFLEEDTPLTDYMATLGGLGLHEQFYMAPRLKLAWKNHIANFESWSSETRMAAHMRGTLPGSLMSALYKSTDRL